MKKQELIHLHGLLAEVGGHFETHRDQELDLESYEALGVRPTSIHRSKTDHKAAVFALMEGVIDEIPSAESTEEPIPAAAD